MVNFSKDFNNMTSYLNLNSPANAKNRAGFLGTNALYVAQVEGPNIVFMSLNISKCGSSDTECMSSSNYKYKASHSYA